MAYNADNAPELEGTLYRDGEYFRINASRSGTPITQFSKTVLVSEREAHARTNHPHRNAPSQLDLDLIQARALMLARSPAPVVLSTIEPPAFEPCDFVTKIAMHGGANTGERRLAQRPRQPHIVTLPVPDMSRAKVGHQWPRATVKHEPVNMHAVAAQRVRDGLADIEALAEARRLADERRCRA